MSTQLILYPQSYKGAYNSVSTPVLFEYFIDGIKFIHLNGSATTGVAGSGSIHSPSALALAALPPNAVGTWYRYRTHSPGTPAFPTQTGNNLILKAVTTGYSGDNGSGVYQRLSNLVPGQSYEVTINVEAPVWGHISVRRFDGNILQNAPSIIYFQSANPSYATTLHIPFTALTTHDVLMVSYFHNTAYTVTINSISVTETHGAPTLVYSELNDGQVICDLYQEEDIPLSLSIDDFKNVAEQVKSYSKDFNLPATKRNNQIFNNMFEVTRTAHLKPEFNPYIRTQCVLKQDGFILFEGYLRLIDVKDKEGEISYSVNLYSDVIALADILKDKTFSELDFTELEHDYNKQEIKRSWNESPDASITYLNPSTSGFRETYDTLRYPFINWTGNIPITANTSTGSGPTPNNPELPSLEAAFRPCIQLRYLINQIFAASGFNWTSDFFDSAVFGKLYMDFNWGSGSELKYGVARFFPTGVGGTDPANVSTTSFTNLRLYEHTPNFPASSVGYDETTGILTSTADDSVYTVDYYFWLNRDITGTADFRWIHRDSLGNTITTIDVTSLSYSSGTSSALAWSGNFTILLDTNETLEPQFKTNITAGVQQKDFFSSSIFGLNPFLITTNTLLQTLRGELGQWDFLKGIMTMFNLVSLVDETNPNNIRIEPYTDVFINNTNCSATGELTLACRGIQHDWTDKVDVSEMELKPLTDLNKKTQFQFVEDEDDYAFQVYKNATSGGLYGSSLQDASGFTILEGEKDIIAEPFASTLSSPLFDQFSSFIVPRIYASTGDGTYEGFENSPRVLYNNGIKSTGASYYIPEQNGLSNENQEDFLQFSHLSTIPSVSATTIDFNFETQQMIAPLGNPPANNLWSTYWQPYFNELYHSDTRIMTLKVNLSPSDVASFKFYDVVFIKNRTFRVNRIDYKPNDLATVEFILIP
tara:strand:+ start:1707 stop:4502 length:2796 start_codon:yes stop_codon:yes gene_type:complete